jgi:hypothetical protein
MSDDVDRGRISPGDSWQLPRARGELTSDGTRYRITWFPARSTTKSALFRVDTADRVVTLQHIRTIDTSQRGDSSCRIDDCPQLEHVDRRLLDLLRTDGFTPAQEGSR